MTKKSLFAGLLLIISQLFAPAVLAADETTPKMGYFTLAPDLTTNFVTTGKKLGYIQVRIDIMVADNREVPLLEHHNPQIRNVLVEVFGQQPENRIKSLAGREEIRKECLTAINELLLAETGKTLAVDLLFTKYIYQ
ncbi:MULTISPECIES: flagellar basal body-associated protein FliL [Aliivibrio]|jgi:flagellar FliL protein|uniref:Flagellar protein FliL n=3 Tax=Aliivibrio TaxID=511678 RepID=A0A1B9NV87_ALILO|nr:MULTISPECIES: flagellar basal body-associated protein FliL [Aliivibrio]AZL85970.1 flagellar basal body-associated protein FliL [Aliivibrio salmonicida]MBB1313362.1 flagellar basal body-associated protein FliL [Aliivibrio sp. SR45-2]OCH18438.1 flagellar basal body-associated protein FliL [Aliivibrio logei]OEF09707.1 flagellar basal body-associated protein FliL [Aliivibrio logei 5S-186]CAQ80581.1 putative flagellar basal body-associated protein FliL [Aliivibrio salmonicida LFI1238]